MSLADRLAMLRRFGQLLQDSSESLAQLITEEMGSPISESRSIQVVMPVRQLEACMEVAESFEFRTVRRSPYGQALVTRQPVGVVAAVIPWNAPATIACQKLVPALAAGCTVVLKPAPETPLDSYFIARLLQEADCPPGVVNVIPAERDVSEYLVSHPGVDKVSFTGSSAAGRRIAAICGNDLRRVTMELGGKSAGIVLDDADLDATVESLRLLSFRNSGQVCSLKTRLLIPHTLHDDFMDRLCTLVDSLTVGDPHDEATDIGPLVSERQRSRVEGFIHAGIGEGAKLVRGGGRPDHLRRGWFVEPTVFDAVDPGATIAQEEIFGPVVGVTRYRDEDEAVEIANNSQYGLSGTVFSADLDRGLRLASRIETGSLELNACPTGFMAPLGGVKGSGIGREFGPEGLEEFVELKSIGIPAELLDALA
jgi:betaine-aldehyde dehydrogenase